MVLSSIVGRLGLAVATAILLASCGENLSFSIGGQSPEDAAIQVIEDDLGPTLGWTLVATCDVDQPEIGDEFRCTATNDSGEIAEFVVLVGDDEVNVNTTNIIANSALQGAEAAALDLIVNSTGVEYSEGSVDCGTASIVIPASGEVDCLLTELDGSETEIYLYDINPDSGDFTLAAR
ncbi:MAG: hypothetical protein GXP35_09430 [Actinobacteria bacterium]|nr:hypothetical protein [Actinomycetota bacterium]